MRAGPIKSATDPISCFLSDVEPFLFNKTISYADLGAGDGSTFLALLDWGLTVDRAVLIEANSGVFVRLLENVASRNRQDTFACINMALPDQGTSVSGRDLQGTSTLGSSSTGASLGEEADTEPTRKFEDLGQFFPDRHVSILKIGVEWHNVGALRQCDALLSALAVDVLCVEADVCAENPQDTYSRDIDCFVTTHGYRLSRVYEVAHGLINEQPGQQRLNLVYFSPTIAARYPMIMTHGLSKLRGQLAAFEKVVLDLTVERDAARADVEKQAKALKERFEEIALLTRSFEVFIEERDTAREMFQSKVVPAKIKPRGKIRRRGYGILIGGAVFYLLALALLLALMA